MYLQEILDHKALEIKSFKERTSYAELEAKIAPKEGRHFYKSLKISDIAIIAEIKKASPSRGLIAADFDPVAIARAYAGIGIRAISILTDERYFQGSMDHLRAARAVVSLPLLRKDFILDEIQVLEACVAGADACLLIVKALSQSRLEKLIHFCREVGVDPLVETHNRDEMDQALAAGADIIGINNRCLDTFQIDLATSKELLPLLPESCLRISESGIQTGADIQALRAAGADAFLVGTAFMEVQDKASLYRELTHAG